ncbi:phosphoribulokinase [Candidatus Thiothrix sp. Deng01]|uniref:phosphoribulokinase n=1 Tax=Candidatus Thiothrix phosphatis TaxID=3112415 RepID=A0ABU6D1Y2_9GAMM|nr:phosphoribulokinase [Candidatus Thiothrix sp. Deng01]MEB4593015.1 phosphoribulokinase [Candidatus Thiothrix sp. Deng01]
MSAEHPIIAITGASGAGSSAVIKALERIFYRERIKAAYIDGSAFHLYDRKTMREKVRQAKEEGQVLSHFSPAGNCLDKLESLFFEYAAVGRGVYRHYLHTQEQADRHGQEPGTLTPWRQMDPDTDLLLYRGLHGAAVIGDIDIAQYPDLGIGMAPNANLEWIRKIQRDSSMRGYSRAEVQESILERLHDYVHYITPQFSRTHINFQMVPIVDTSDPFGDEEAPEAQECFLVMRFTPPFLPNFVPLLRDIPGAFMSRRNTLVVQGSKMGTAIELILMPIIHDMITKSRTLRGIASVPEDRGAGVLGLVE